MAGINIHTRCLLALCGVAIGCGSIGCGGGDAKIDEHQLAIRKQQMEIEKSLKPVEVPDGAREIPTSFAGSISEFKISPDRSRILVVATDPADERSRDFSPSKTFIVDPTDGRLLSKFDLPFYHAEFSLDGRRLAAIGEMPASVEGTTSIYDVRVADIASGQWQFIVGKSLVRIHAICWSEDGQHVMTVAITRPVLSKEESEQFRREKPDELLSLVGDSQVEFKFWNSQTGELWKTVAGPKLEGDRAILSQDGRFAAIWNSTNVGDVVICSPATGEELSRCVGHDLAVQEVIFGPAGNLLATRETLTEDTTANIAIWERKSGERLCEFDSHAVRMAFSPDERLLATANLSLDEQKQLNWDVTIWNVDRGEITRTLEPGGENARVAFLSNRELLTSSIHSRKSRMLVRDVAEP
ncbi:MAG: hypothetical protein R3C20_15365 [Planctomycetaceae bacterium]